MSTKTTPRILAQEWGVTVGRISQLVAEGMPLTSKEDATHWRRKRWDTIHGGALPYYLKTYDQKFSLEQRVYDLLAYVHKIDRYVASQAAFLIFCAIGNKDFTGASDCSHDRIGGHDRGIDAGSEFPTATWFVPDMAHDPADTGWTKAEAAKFMKEAEELDRAELKREGII